MRSTKGPTGAAVSGAAGLESQDLRRIAEGQPNLYDKIQNTTDVDQVVFGHDIDGEKQTLDDIKLPSSLRALCQGVPESVFRNDISSTRIRAGQQLNRPDSQE